MQNIDIAPKVRLCAVPTDKFKTCRINVSLAMPLDSNASARAILPYYLHRRCAKYPDFIALNRQLDELYGATVSGGVSKRGEAQLISLSLTAIDDRFALDGDKVALQCAELLADMLFDPIREGDNFPESIIEQEKHLLCEDIQNEMNDKRRYAAMRCEEIMFADEAYSINRLGKADEVKKLTAQDVFDAWEEELRESTVQITMVGSMDVQPVADMFKERFAKIRRIPAEIETQFITAVPKPEYVCETMPIKQGKLVMGFRTGMRDEYDNTMAMRVAVDIFGGGTYSKLFSVVREKMSLCYYCSAGFFTPKGIVLVQSGIEDANEEKAKKEIINQLSLVAQGDFSDEDFSASIKSISDSVISNNDTPESICGWYNSQIFRPEFRTPEDYVQELKNVDKQQVISAAKTIMLDTVFMLKSEGEVKENENQ